ncbi:MFS transporter TsgA [Buchnera aphidicola (Mindarus keteleerifoliae)]|uniref:MFS transporter TsgA n=1 Tax=Buchnera aphidicola TaxID=9 RepID=UPI0031B6CB70
MKNKILLTIISFFSYFITGGLIVTTGMILGKIAKYFDLSTTNMSSTFTFLNAGLLISIFLNAWIIEFISIKKQLISGFLLMLFAIIGLIKSSNLIIFSGSIFIFGLVSGITMSIGTFLITILYKGNQRIKFLLLTDSFFSMSGMIFPFIATKIFDYHLTWYWIYILIFSVYIIIFFLTINAKFPIPTKRINLKKIKIKKNFIIGNMLLSIMALLYILGQLSFISWIPEYATQLLKLNIKEAGKLVSFFWMSYMIGMWFFSLILKFFDLQKILVLLTGTSSFIMYLFIGANNLKLLSITIISLGFFSSAIYTVIITLSSLQTKNPSPKQISFVLTSGTVGTLLTFIVTKPIIIKKGLIFALITANFLYTIVFCLSITFGFFTNHRKNIIHNHNL